MNARSAEICIPTFIPNNLQRFPSLNRVPRRVCDDGNPLADFHDMPDTCDGFSFRPIEAFHLPSEYRASGNDRVQHSRYSYIDAKYRSAIDLLRCVEAVSLLSNNAKVFRI